MTWWLRRSLSWPTTSSSRQCKQSDRASLDCKWAQYKEAACCGPWTHQPKWKLANGTMPDVFHCKTMAVVLRMEGQGNQICLSFLCEVMCKQSVFEAPHVKPPELSEFRKRHQVSKNECEWVFKTLACGQVAMWNQSSEFSCSWQRLQSISTA